MISPGDGLKVGLGKVFRFLVVVDPPLTHVGQFLVPFVGVFGWAVLCRGWRHCPGGPLYDICVI